MKDLTPQTFQWDPIWIARIPWRGSSVFSILAKVWQNSTLESPQNMYLTKIGLLQSLDLIPITYSSVHILAKIVLKLDYFGKDNHKMLQNSAKIIKRQTIFEKIG